jgi:Ca2+-binding EF-hand superfamily protein
VRKNRKRQAPVRKNRKRQAPVRKKNRRRQRRQARISAQIVRNVMGRGMMGRGMMGHGMCMRVMFVLMDTDGDGTLSLEEFQTAHAKIFKAIDANKDGKVTLEEMQMFFHGGSPTSDR